MTRQRALRTLLALAALALAACSDGSGAGTAADASADGSGDAGGLDVADTAEEAPPFAEIEETYMRHIGAFPPTERNVDGDETSFEYDYPLEAGGPLCIRGTPYRVSIRDMGSPNTLFYMQGGGLCYSGFCFAIEGAGSPGVPRFDVLDPDDPDNPFADWNVVYLPYCDGSLFAGEMSYDVDDDGEPDRIHRGFANLSVGMDALVENFGDSERVLIAGSSGGGFGTIWGAPLVRMLMPEVDLMVFNDAGVGVVRGNEPEFALGLVEEFGAQDLVPPSCSTCIDDGHLTPLVAWVHERDPTIRTAAFSSYGDAIIATIFLEISAAEFEEALLRELGGLADQFPGRYGAFLIEGSQHTVLLGDIAGFIGEDLAGESGNPFEAFISLARLGETFIGEVSAREWLGWFLDDDPRWGALYE